MRHLRHAWVLTVFLALPACVSANPELFPPRPGESVFPIFIVAHRWHTGLVIPRSYISDMKIPEARDFASFENLEIGWGERDFYMAAGDSVPLAFKALFWPNDSVLHVVGFNGPTDGYFKRSAILRVDLSKAGLDALIDYIATSFDRGEGNSAERLGVGLYGPSYFYAATGTFYFLQVCNKWTAKALRAAGAPIATAFAFTTGNVFYQAREFGKVIREEE